MSYVKTAWENQPSTSTPISAVNLNKIESALDFSINKSIADATLNTDWEAGSAVGTQFVKVGSLVVANFAATITNTTGLHLFMATIPEGFRPLQSTAFPAVFVPQGSTDYHPRMVIANTNGTVQIANTPTELGTFFCAMVYFVA